MFGQGAEHYEKKDNADADVVKICSGEVLLLGHSKVLRIDEREEFDESFAQLTAMLHDDPIVDIAQGKSHYLVLTTSGRLFSFGSNEHGQLGLGHTRTVRLSVYIRI